MAKYNQSSFNGGINLLLDDTRLPISVRYKEGDSPYDVSSNQYRIGYNLRNRFDVLSPVPSSVIDVAAPTGVKQGCLTFGNYIILFAAGYCYYKFFTDTGWRIVNGFSMSTDAPRYWFIEVPLATTNYGRLALPNSSSVIQANLPISQVNQVSGTFGLLPGLLVQDGINQPQFVYVDQNGNIQCRITQQYAEWTYDPTGVNDRREYVPIGTFMEWNNGILHIVAPDLVTIYRSVSGRPLDFVINVDKDGKAGGNALTTSYSVGVGGISCLRSMPDGSLFVSAGNTICFSVTLNTTPNAPTIFGEYTFIRKTLFNSSCMSDRGIIDVLGDTNFIDLNGLRSFNAVLQQQNEGRNSVFSSTISKLFEGVFQDVLKSSAILFDNYAIFSVKTVIGYVLVVYDTINNCWSSIDTQQLGNHAAKQFCKLEISAHALYCITDDNRFVQLYASSTISDNASVRLGSLCSQEPSKEMGVDTIRVVFSNITQDVTVTCSIFVNNRLSQIPVSSTLKYKPPTIPYTGSVPLLDVDTQVNNLLFSLPNAGSGWKTFFVFSWTGGASLTNIEVQGSDETPMQPTLTQAVISQQ